MKQNDDRVLDTSCHELVHHILKRIRECEVENIDIDDYIPKQDLREIISILDCCLQHKDSKYISRRS